MIITTPKRFTCNLAGKFNSLIFTLAFVFTSLSYGVEAPAYNPQFNYNLAWDNYVKQMKIKNQDDYRNGLSYVISGSLALVGGIVGDRVTNDNLEKATYTIFQTIGIASIGYGAYTWKIGSEDRSIYYALSKSPLTAEQKMQFLESYKIQKKEQLKRENTIRAITHGLIAALNFYNASSQGNESMKNGLYFIGGVNLLAALSYSVEF